MTSDSVGDGVGEQVDKHIQVMELFGPTIQGEGIMTGTITHFLRVGGCSLRCSWCDSLFAVIPKEIKKHRTLMRTDEVLQAILALPYAPYVTFTGGDPAIQDRLGDLILALNQNGIRVAVETQGMFFPSWFDDTDVLTFSPKGPSSGNVVDPADLWAYCTGLGIRRKMKICIKIVVFNQEDFDYAMDVYTRIPAWSYDSFYFTAGTPSYPEGSFDITADHDEMDVETNKLNRCIDVLHNQHTLAEMMLNAQVAFNEKVHLGCQQHVLLWPDKDKGV